ncbi:MAG: hypothetical protein IJQ07_00325 [Clostridia bacterium]|nr:hypothetical protein [Clostridia bacterium]
MKYLLGADFGTTSLKMCLFDEKGKQIVSESAQYNLITEGEFVEFPAEEFFNVFKSVLKRITDKYPVYAMSIDTQGETLIVLDKDNKPLTNAIIWLDNRAAKQAKEIEEKFSVKGIYELTGQAEIPAGYPAPKILWLKENKPEVYNNAKHYLLLEDYIIYRLTGKFAASRSLYSSSLLMDIKTGEYIPEMLDYLGISKGQLSTLKESGEYIGEYNGIKIVTSALDQIAGITGAGVVKTGIMSETTGTSLAVSVLTDTIPLWHERLTVSAYYVKKGLYCLLMWAPTAGATLEWFKKNFCESDDYAKLNTLAESVPKGAEGLICIPHLCGTVIPENNAKVKGVFFGATLKHNKGHFIRAIMESIAYTIKEYAYYISADIAEIRSMGGGANSKLWCEIKAEVLNKKVITLKENETACLGSAIFAGTGAGIYADTFTATEKIVKKNKEYVPKEDGYSVLYKAYKEKEKKITEIYK